jgi:predicted membrane channel-forming protein YqfA (hemolysin III family)
MRFRLRERIPPGENAALLGVSFVICLAQIVSIPFFHESSHLINSNSYMAAHGLAIAFLFLLFAFGDGRLDNLRLGFFFWYYLAALFITFGASAILLEINSDVALSSLVWQLFPVIAISIAIVGAYVRGSN